MSNETYHKRGELVHGYRVRKHPLYGSWASMKGRCRNPKDPAYKDYGGRGIDYCKRWEHFKNYAVDMWPKPPGKTLERKNNNKGYSSSNCIWASRAQQARNRRKFLNNQSGFTGIVPIKKGYNARYDNNHVRYDLGNFDTLEEAKKTRNKFIRLYKTDNLKFKNMLSGGYENKRLSRNSSTKIKGISVHKQGFIIRKRVNGERQYLGFAKTFDEALEIWRNS